MALLNYTREKDSAYQLVSMVTELDLRPDTATFKSEEYAELVRVVLTFDMSTVLSVEVVGGVYAQYSLDNVYFQGAGPITITSPPEFGPFVLVRQSSDAVESPGGKFIRMTEEYIMRRYDDNGNPAWIEMDWSQL